MLRLPDDGKSNIPYLFNINLKVQMDYDKIRLGKCKNQVKIRIL